MMKHLESYLLQRYISVELKLLEDKLSRYIAAIQYIVQRNFNVLQAF